MKTSSFKWGSSTVSINVFLQIRSLQYEKLEEVSNILLMVINRTKTKPASATIQLFLFPQGTEPLPIPSLYKGPQNVGFLKATKTTKESNNTNFMIVSNF